MRATRKWPTAPMVAAAGEEDADGNVIILDVDWGHEWPLWTEYWPAEPAQFGLSRELTQDLREFHKFWEEHCSPEEGWDLPGNLHAALNKATELTAAVRHEVGSRFEVMNGFEHSHPLHPAPRRPRGAPS